MGGARAPLLIVFHEESFMEQEIQGIHNGISVREQQQKDAAKKRKLVEKEQKQPQNRPVRSREELISYLRKVLNITSSLNRRLQFSINRELGEVVVKVIDSETDKVIREVPPEELQRLHIRMREIIGLLFDQEI
jgi:flagellar protein FlaG